MYHITKSGEFAPCKASVQACPLGGPHGTVAELELILAKSLDSLSSLTKQNPYELPPSEEFPDDWNDGDIEFWGPIKETLGAYIFQGKGYVPSDPDTSVFYCLDCYARLPKSDAYKSANWRVDCPGCGKSCMDGLTGVALKHGDERYFHKQAVLESEWYHYTSRENWEQYLDPEFEEARVIHLGSKDAALDRRDSIKQYSGKLYKIRLKSEAEIADEILEDDPFNQLSPPLVSEGGSPKGVFVSGVTRYLNYYEDPGSFSLIVNPRLVEIVECEEYSEDS